MNSLLINNIYLVWFNPSEFPYFYEEYRSQWREYLITLYSAFSVTIAAVYMTPPYRQGSGAIIVLSFLAHSYFLSLMPSFFGGFLDFQIRKIGGSGDLNQLISFIRYSLSFFSLFTPISVLLMNFNFGGLLGFFVILTLSVILVLLNISRGASEIYKMDLNIVFKFSILAYLSTISIPIVLTMYYITTFLGLVL
jgi:hypothetical protein